VRYPASASARPLLLALLLAAAAWLGTLAVDRAPPAQPLDANATSFSGERARALLQRLLGEELPHPLGSAANAQLRERIVSELRALGLTPVLRSGFMVCTAYGVCGVPTNIVARIRGADKSDDRPVLLSAHYDSVPAGPGASDNGVGVAAVLEITRILQLLPRQRHPIIVLIDDGEEVDLLGAYAFMQHDPWAAGVGAAVNLDARGSSGPSLMFETGSDNRWLMNLYAAAVARPPTNSMYYAVYKMLPNDTDFTVYKAAGLQGYNFAFIGDVAHYHTPLDNIAHADARSLQHQGDNALATLLALANADPDPGPVGEAVYFDVFTALLVRFPQAWVWPATALILLLIVIAGARLVQLARLSWRALAWGVAAQLAALLLGVAAAAALVAVMRALGVLGAGGAAATVAHPWALQLGFAAVAFFVTTLIGARLQRRAGFCGLWYSGSLLCALLAIPLARWLPGASYLALLPALAALLALLPALRSGIAGQVAGAQWGAPAACALTFVLVLPIATPLFAALGADGLPLLTLLLIYASFGVAALVAIIERPLQRLLLAAAALCALSGFAAAALLPRYTAESPQRLNLRYELDADSQRAQWVADPLSSAVPAPLLHAAAFARSAPPASSWNRDKWVAPATALPLASPWLTLISVEGGAQQRLHYRVRVASARGAPVVTLQFPPEAQVRRVSVEGAEPADLEVRPRHLNHGWSQLRLTSVPPDGQQLSFEAGIPAFELRLQDESFGLPDAGAVLQLARPATAVPWQDGDVTIVTRSYRLSP
jgi:hypothetical protein